MPEVKDCLVSQGLCPPGGLLPVLPVLPVLRRRKADAWFALRFAGGGGGQPIRWPE
jgi:hypothetical protein